MRFFNPLNGGIGISLLAAITAQSFSTMTVAETTLRDDPTRVSAMEQPLPHALVVPVFVAPHEFVNNEPLVGMWSQAPPPPKETRRTPATSSSNADTLFFATNRLDEGADKPFRSRFGDRDGALTCGTVRTGGGETEFEIKGKTATGTSCRELLPRNRPVVVYVHGSETNFTDALYDGRRLSRVFGDSVSVLTFSWPNETAIYWIGNPARRYRLNQQHARTAMARYDELTRLLGEIRSVTVAHIGYSMGGRVIAGLAQGGALRSATARLPKCAHMILIASELSSREAEGSLTSLGAHCHNLTIYTNWHDPILAAAAFANRVSHVLGQGRWKGIPLEPANLTWIEIDQCARRLSDISHKVRPDCRQTATHNYLRFDRVLKDVRRIIVDDMSASRRAADGSLRAVGGGRHMWALQ